MRALLRLKRLLDGTSIGSDGYAKLLGIANKTLYNKLLGKTAFTYPEYLELKRILPEYNVDYLLTEDQDST